MLILKRLKKKRKRERQYHSYDRFHQRVFIRRQAKIEEILLNVNVLELKELGHRHDPEPSGLASMVQG